MTRDVAAARAAVGQAALARDEAALRAIADSLPPLAAYGYERHRARAFANAIRGAHDSAVAELCLGVAACPPAASTFVADSAQLRLLGDVREPGPVGPTPRPRSAWAGSRLAASGLALAAAVAALVVLPGHVFEDTRPESAGITGPARSAPPRVVVAEQPPGPAASPSGVPAGDRALGGADPATLVSAETPGAGTVGSLASPESTDPPAPRAAVSQPRPRAQPRPAPPRPPAEAPTPAPAPPSAPPPAPPAETPTSAPTPAATTAASAPASPAREPKGKARGKAHAPGQLKQEPGRPAEPPPPAPPAPAAPSGDPPPSPQGPPDPHPGRGHGRDGDRGP